MHGDNGMKPLAGYVTDSFINFPSLCRVPIPFKVDRLNLRSDERWSRIVAETHEQRIIWADNVQKLNRKDGKVNK